MADDQRTVLITRPQPGASETATRVAALGYRPIIAPVFEVVGLPVRLPAPSDVSAVLVTSGNAIMALGPDFAEHPVLCVGDATARRAQAAGLRQAVSAGGDAADLAQLAAARCPKNGAPLLLVSGEGQGAALARMLRDSGFRLLRRAVYATRPVHALPSEAVAVLHGSTLHASLFLSAETARIFVRLIKRARLSMAVRGVRAVAIGPAAGVALEALPWRDIRVARRPNQDEMFALLHD